MPLQKLKTVEFTHRQGDRDISYFTLSAPNLVFPSAGTVRLTNFRLISPVNAPDGVPSRESWRKPVVTWNGQPPVNQVHFNEEAKPNQVWFDIPAASQGVLVFEFELCEQGGTFRCDICLETAAVVVAAPAAADKGKDKKGCTIS